MRFKKEDKQTRTHKSLKTKNAGIDRDERPIWAGDVN